MRGRFEEADAPLSRPPLRLTAGPGESPNHADAVSRCLLDAPTPNARMMKRIAVLAGVLALAIPAIANATIIGDASAAQNPPATLHLKYRVLVSNVQSLVNLGGNRDLVASGRYVGYLRPSLHPLGEQFVLVDDKTGKQIAAKWPTSRIGRYLAVCSPTLGDTWLAFECDTGSGIRLRFYNLHTRKWRGVACDSTCQHVNNPQVLAVGARWFLLTGAPDAPCGDNVHNDCGPGATLYYSIATGKRGFPQVDAHTIIDLDSSTLTQPVCRPLQAPLPNVGGYLAAFPPSLTFFGRFAVSEETSGLYVEECGSQLHLPLVGAGYEGRLFGASQAVAFWNSNPQVSGIFLPSLRRFTFNVPSGFSGAALGPRHLYVITPTHVWVAALPSKLRRGYVYMGGSGSVGGSLALTAKVSGLS